MKLLNGSAAHHPERSNPSEPQAVALVVAPEPPAYMPLAGVARQVWDDLAGRAVELRVLTAADISLLAITCDAFAEYRQARREKGGWRRASDAWKRYVTGCREFGLSPSARTRLHAAPVAKADPVGDLIAQRNRARA